MIDVRHDMRNDMICLGGTGLVAFPFPLLILISWSFDGLRRWKALYNSQKGGSLLVKNRDLWYVFLLGKPIVSS